MKICIKCQQSKSLDQYLKTGTDNKYIRNKCRACHNEDQKPKCKEHYENNKASYIKRNKPAKILLRQFYIELKHNKPCSDCKDIFPWWILEFDHRDSKTKLHNVSYLATISKEKLLLEVAKCDLVCANCHKNRTHKRLEGLSV
jgi:hypothetical protein